MKKVIAVLVLGFISAACGRYYGVSVDTFADREVILNGFPEGTSFEIKPSLYENQMLSKEVAGKIGDVLRKNGYKVSSDQPDYVLSYEFNISSETVTVHVPTEIPVATEESTSFTRVYEPEWKYRSMNEGKKQEEFGAKWSYSKTIYVPEEQTTYTSHLKLRVLDGTNEVWTGSAEISEKRGDLREKIDYLLASAFEYFGQNTYKTVYVKMSDKKIDELIY